MKTARFGLSRHIQAFFETELCGLFRFDQVTIRPPESAAHPVGLHPLRRPPFGRHREIVEIRFGQYDLAVSSPNEKPPLGEIVLSHPDGEETGPLDYVTWQRIGSLIRNREREISNAA